jgi:hypothetical protein
MRKLVWILKGYQGNGVFLTEVCQAPDFIQDLLLREIRDIDLYPLFCVFDNNTRTILTVHKVCH